MAREDVKRFIVAAGVLAIVFGPVSSAFALDAFWQGRRGPVWEHGIDLGGKSNWYSRAQGGRAREVPNGKAVFPAEAQEFDIWISEPRTRIQTMVIQNDAPRYDFKIRRGAELRVTGIGIVNKSPVPARFIIRENGTMRLRNAARPISSRRSAIIHVGESGRLGFWETSGGGNAVVRNEGIVQFFGHASADEMSIENGDPFGHGNFPEVIFFDHSTAGSARITNFSILDFKTTRGPDDDGKITAGTIDNRFNLFLGKNTLTVDSFVQNPEGSLDLEIISNRSFGNILVRGPAQLAGNLNVNHTALHDVAPGSYRVLYAEGGRTGGFVLSSTISKSRLAYSSKEVYLIVDP